MNYGLQEPLTIEELAKIAIDKRWERIETELSEYDLEEVRRNYATICLEIDQLEMEKKHAMSHFSSQIKNADTRREELRTQITTKIRREDASVYLVPDHERDVMQMFHAKTGVKIKERPLEEWERQQSALEDFANEETEAETETADATAAA